jgi:hypothetical protein
VFKIITRHFKKCGISESESNMLSTCVAKTSTFIMTNPPTPASGAEDLMLAGLDEKQHSMGEILVVALDLASEFPSPPGMRFTPITIQSQDCKVISPEVIPRADNFPVTEECSIRY